MPKQLAPVYISQAEETKLLAQAKNERDRLLMQTLLETGGRVSEVLAMKPGDVQGDIIYMMTEKRPGHPVRPVVVPGELPGKIRLYVANHRIQPDEPIFRGRNGALTRQMAWLIVKTCAERAGIKRLRDGHLTEIWPHVLRHTYAIELKKQVLVNPLETLQLQLGHADIASTMVYGRQTIDDTRAAVAGVHFGGSEGEGC